MQHLRIAIDKSLTLRNISATCMNLADQGQLMLIQQLYQLVCFWAPTKCYQLHGLRVRREYACAGDTWKCISVQFTKEKSHSRMPVKYVFLTSTHWSLQVCISAKHPSPSREQEKGCLQSILERKSRRTTHPISLDMPLLQFPTVFCKASMPLESTSGL